MGLGMDMDEIPDEYILKDIRCHTHFSVLTISGYKKKDVLVAYQSCLINEKLNDCIHWCVELHCSNLENKIFEILEKVYIQYIHIYHPKAWMYFMKRKKRYEEILATSTFKKKHIYSKNNQEIRNLLCELTALFCLSKKDQRFIKNLPKMTNDSYSTHELKKRMIGKNIDILNEKLNYVAMDSHTKYGLNEIYWNIHHGTYENCMYWYAWLEKMEKSKSIQRNGEVWVILLWKVLFHFEHKLCPKSQIYFKKLHSKYMDHFKTSKIQQRKYYIFIAMHILKKPLRWKESLYIQESYILQCIGNINKVYEKIVYEIDKYLTPEHVSLFYTLFQSETQKRCHPSKKEMKMDDLHAELNKIEFTHHPEFKEMSVRDKTNDILSTTSDEEMISKNMTQKDIDEENISKLDVKLNMFRELVFKKKETPQMESTVISPSPPEIRNIIISKK
jgi:hypothetical protein